MADRTGEQLGTYRLIQRIGHGGYADVYLAKHMYLPRQAAIKVLTTSLNDVQLREFLAEAQLLATLTHPHIVRLVDFAIEQGMPYLVMEYAPRGSLRTLYPRSTILPPHTVATIAGQMADALQYAHNQNVIHRDVKPENMLVGSGDEILLGDFGISVIEQSSEIQHTQGSVGTPAYMAPEQVLGSPRRASDQYSLAIIVYEWLCGRPPFLGSGITVAMQHVHNEVPPLQQFAPNLPEEIALVIMHALSKKPEDRFPDIRAFAQALQEAVRMTQSTQTLRELQSAPAMLPPPVSSVPRVPPGSVFLQSMQSDVATDAATSFHNDQTSRVSAAELAQYMQAPDSKIADLRTRPPRFKSFVKQRPLVIGLAALTLVLLAALLIQLPATVSNIQGNANATATAYSQATATVAPQATATAVAQAYQTYVHEHGIRAGFDMHHSGYNPYEIALSSSNVSRLTERWSFSTDGIISSSPVVVDDTLYVASEDRTVYAIDTKSGRQRWAFSTRSKIASAPAIVDGVVYIGSHDDYLYAIDAESGDQRWKFDADGDVTSSPAVVDGVVYIGSANGKVYAVNANSGSEIWDFTTYFLVSSSPSVVDGTVYIGSWDKNVYAIDAQTGKQRWKFATKSIVHSTPTIVDDIVYIGSADKMVYALDVSSGKKVWEFETDEYVTSSPAFFNGKIYIGSNDKHLYAIDAKTGQEVWRFSTGDAVTSSPLVANGVVYIGSNDKNLYAIDAETGARLWNTPTSGAVASTPAVAQGVVYVGSHDKNVYAFALPDNTQ